MLGILKSGESPWTHNKHTNDVDDDDDDTLRTVCVGFIIFLCITRTRMQL